jgi:hypothetical protein
MRHGGLMVVGFVVTVIAVERAVAVRNIPAFAAPALSAATGLGLMANADGRIAPVLALAAAVAYSINVAVLLQRHRMPPFALALCGAVCLIVAGAVWWAGEGIAYVVPWWIVFLVLTIAAERLEILRFRRFSRPEVIAGALTLVLVLAGAAVSLTNGSAGFRVLGLGLIALALWLLGRDIAMRTIRTDGLARYAASGVLAAYCWLALGGLLLLTWGFRASGFQYDALIHTFFVGFVFSAIMAHEPIIAPAVTGLRFSYTPLLYLPLAFLNASLVLRLAADLSEASEARRWAGMIQAISILLFLVISVGSVLVNRHRLAAEPRLPGLP